MAGHKPPDVIVMPAAPPPPPPATSLAHTPAPGAIQTQDDAVALMNGHIDALCRQMGQTSDALLLEQLRADIHEAESRKRMVLGLFQKDRKREQRYRSKFVRYRKGVPFKEEETLLLAAELAGLDGQNLTYEQFRELLLDKSIWKLAKKTSRKIQAHEHQQTNRVIDRYRTSINQGLAEKQGRYAKQRLSDNRRRQQQDRIPTAPPPPRH